MNKIDWKRKLSSRKLWAAVVGIITGLAMVFGLDESTINSVAGAVVSVTSVVAYIITEGKVDAANAKRTARETMSRPEAPNVSGLDPAQGAAGITRDKSSSL